MNKTIRPGAMFQHRDQAEETISGEMLLNITRKPNGQRHRIKAPSRLLGYRVDGHLSVFPIWAEVRNG